MLMGVCMGWEWHQPDEISGIIRNQIEVVFDGIKMHTIGTLFYIGKYHPSKKNPPIINKPGESDY